MDKGWNCAKHASQPVSFICTGNVWHFEPLCNLCVPEHTKNHPKNIKIQLESIEAVSKRADQLKGKARQVFKQRLQKGTALLQVPESQFNQIKSLREKQAIIIKEINSFFQVLIKDAQNQRAKNTQQHRNSLCKLVQNLETRMGAMSQQLTQLQEFCRNTRTFYFKDDFATYVQQFDEVLKDYQEQVIVHNPIVWPKDIQGSCQTFISGLLRREAKIDKAQLAKTQKKDMNAKKQTKKIGRRKCGQCKTQMQYLTQWKKHLVCPSCGQKERNYGQR